MSLPKLVQDKTDYVKCADLMRLLHQMRETNTADENSIYTDPDEIIESLLVQLGPEN